MRASLIKSNKSIAAVLLAAGTGSRAQLNIPKQYVKLPNGKTALEYCLDIFLNRKQLQVIALVVNQEHEDFYQPIINLYQDKSFQIIKTIGGATRQESTYNGLAAIAGLNIDYVHIHDSARPFISMDLLDRLEYNLHDNPAVIPAIPVTDTIKQTDKQNNIIATIDRSALHKAQTPQSFHFSAIYDAHKKAASISGEIFTDDASIASWNDINCKIIMGEVNNLKLTWPDDFPAANQPKSLNNKAENIMNYPDIRVGQGYDIHRLNDGNFVTLAGIKIPHNQGLDAHSDGDVAFHALTDAILGTLGLGDIGVFFPPSDEQWKDQDSSIFLKFALDKVSEQKGIITNIDISIICEAPKISPYREKMLTKLAELTKLERHRISIKATTNEKVGAIGRNEAIAALALVTILY